MGPLVLVGKGLVLGGSTTKIEDFHRFQVYTYLAKNWGRFCIGKASCKKRLIERGWSSPLFRSALILLRQWMNTLQQKV